MTAAPVRGYAPTPGFTPSVGAYALAIGISAVMIAIGIPVGATIIDQGWPPWSTTDVEWAFFAGPLVFAFFVVPVGAVAGPVGALVVHICCRRVRPQWVHVGVTAVVGMLAAWAFVGGFVQEPVRDWDRVSFGIAGCTAFSRAALIPWVPVVQASYPPGTPWWRRFRLR